MNVYVAGPMRGLPEYNFPAFDQAAYRLKELGHTVFSPAERDRTSGFDPNLTIEEQNFSVQEAMRADLAYIVNAADAIVLLDGWENSSGARCERYVAEMCGKKVMFWNSGVICDASPWDAEVAERPGDKECAQLEKLVVDADTGGAKGSKLARYDLIPADALLLLAEHYGRGANKYESRNWERGYAWSLSFAALNRHLWAFWSGEDLDPDTGAPHMVAVAWHAFALLRFMQSSPEKDDR